MKDASGERSCLKSMCYRTIRRPSFTDPPVRRGSVTKDGGWQREDDRGNGSPAALHDHNISIPYSNVRAVNPKSVDAAET
jgi:hypothetical protein